MKGNDAMAEAAVQAGCRFYAGYPITPQNEVPEYMSWRMPKAGGTFIQAEAELSAINMIFGAAAAGTRCMTSSSSPGISLKQEGISYLASAQLPCVIANIMRGGPGLGNIRGSQADYFQAVKGGGHGDYRLITLAPSTLQELYDLTMDAFDYADLYRTPVMILGDGILGPMVEPLVLKEYEQKFPLPDKSGWTLTGCKGREPHTIKTLLLDPPDLLVRHNIALQEKFSRIESALQLCEEYLAEDAEILLCAYGTTARVCKEAVDLAREQGIRAGMLRPITLWPFPKKAFRKYEGRAFFTVEMSAGQFVEDVKLSVSCNGRFFFLGFGGGWYPTMPEVFGRLKEIAKKDG